MFDRISRRLLRWRTPIQFTDFRRTKPAGLVFGLDRGTPIDRYYIERFLSANSALIRGAVLEVGGSSYSKRFGARNVERFHVLALEGEHDDLTNHDTLPKEEIDCFICTQTFNFIFEVQKAISGAHYVLKPGGVLLATVAGICQISRYDMDRWGDYWRFTIASLQKLFDNAFSGEVKIASHGNVLAATALLQGIAVEDLPNESLLDECDTDYQVLLTVVARKAL